MTRHCLTCSKELVRGHRFRKDGRSNGLEPLSHFQKRCILAGSRPGDIVMDPFMGSGTTAMVAESLGRQFIGCELNPAYVEIQSQHRRTTMGLEL